MTAVADNTRARLEKAVAESDLSMRDIAHRSGYHFTHLYNLLSGRRPLRKRTVIAIATAIGRDPADFLGDDA